MGINLYSRIVGVVVTAFVIGIASTLASAQAPQQGMDQSQGQAAAVKGDEELKQAGEKTTNEVCTQCHGIEDVTAQRRSVRDWNDVVGSMVERGAGGTDDEIATIKQYLSRFYGTVNVNTAAAGELSAVLGLSTKDAEAVVQYRTANGKFADAAALSKVPGIDTARIDAHADALLFS